MQPSLRVPNHQPLNYYAEFDAGTANGAAHLKDYNDLISKLQASRLPGFKKRDDALLANGKSTMGDLSKALKQVVFAASKRGGCGRPSFLRRCTGGAPRQPV